MDSAKTYVDLRSQVDDDFLLFHPLVYSSPKSFIGRRPELHTLVE